MIRDTPTERERIAPPTPHGFDDFPSRPARTPLEQKLYSELEKARAKKAATQ